MNPRRDALVISDKSEQDVLGADVRLPEPLCFARRILEHLLCARRERNLALHDLVALADDPRHLRAHVLDPDLETLENACRDAFLLAQQAEQDVLGANVVVLQRTRFVLREDDDLTRALGEALEHASSLRLDAMRL
jgi:hypothetical protein